MIKKDDVIDALRTGDGFRKYYSEKLMLVKQGHTTQARCPFHDDKHPSLSVNLQDGKFNCFGCGKSGDIFAFRMAYENVNFDECLKRFAMEYNVNSCEEPKISVTKADVEIWNKNLQSEKAKQIKKFLNETRGINDKSIQKYSIGYDFTKSAVTIPVYDDENLACVKFFNYDVKTGEKQVTTKGKAAILGLHYLSIFETEDADIYICEGELDAILLSQFRLLTLSGSAGSKTWKKEWSKYLRGANIFICYDSDESGREGAMKVAGELKDYAKSIKIIDLFGEKGNKDMKDITDYFMKCKFDIADFHRLVANTNTLDMSEIKPEKKSSSSGNVNPPEKKTRTNSETSISKDDFLFMLKNVKRSLKVNSSQDYADGKMFYAVSVDNIKYIISSDKSVVKFAGAAERGIILTAMEPDMFGFSAKGIIDFLNDEMCETPYDIFEMIKNYISRYIFLKKKETYSLLAIWAMGSYFYRLFRYYPYIHLNAEKGSGKTMLMEIMAPICFNGQISTNSTDAVIFRDIQNNSPTMFLDELEKMSKEDREKFAGIMSVLKTGFSKNGLVKRCDGKNKDKIRSFSTYAPKMFAGIKDIDDVLSDRTIKIKMFRKLNNELFERYVESNETAQFQSYLRDCLYSFGLNSANEIEKIYNESMFNQDNLIMLSNREEDIWLPVFTLAYYIDKCGKSSLLQEMIDFSKSYIEEKRISDCSENDTSKLLNVLNQFLETNQPDTVREKLLYYKTDTLFDYFKSQEDFSWLDSKTWLTRHLKKIEVKSDTFFLVDKSIRGYVINTEILTDYTRRYC